jgi:hypothetical protein
MVVSAIFVVLSAVVLANHSRFGNVIVLQNLAHDVALAVREAQVYGIAVKGYASGGETSFEYGYGVHFAPGVGYELFADVNANGIWDANETVKSTTMGGGYQITSVCAPDGSCSHDRLDILFKRPEPDACISINGVTSIDDEGDCTSSISRGSVVVSANSGDTATVVVESTGQISVQ